MKHLQQMKKLAGLTLAAALIAGCSGQPEPGQTDPGAGICPEENRVLVDDHKYCILTQPIIEKGFSCPADLSYRHEIAQIDAQVCSDQEMLPPMDEERLRELILDPPNSKPWFNNTSPEPSNNLNPNNNTSPEPMCSTPDPSARGCDSDADCSGGQVCDVIDAQACNPGSCFCDAESDAWACTEDCNPAYGCVDMPTETCGGQPDPSVQPCDVDADCPGEQVCGVSAATVCVPSSCSCDENSMSWICTEDCGTPRACTDPDTNPPGTCGGQPDPSEQPCSQDADCGDSEACVPSGDDSCVPSSCGCDEASGSWECTADCGQPMECRAVSDGPAMCGGQPDPSYQECDVDEDCGEGEACLTSAAAVCVSSSCACDEESGGWSCTDDCNAPRQCGVE